MGPDSGKGLGRLIESRTEEGEEARLISCGTSGDCEGGEKAVGEGEGTGQEGGRVATGDIINSGMPPSVFDL